MRTKSEERGAHTDPPREGDTGQPDRILNNPNTPVPTCTRQSTPARTQPAPSTTLPRCLYARHPRVSSNQAGRPKDTGGATKTGAEYHLPDYTEPEPSTAHAPEEEGEATCNNVVMSAGKRSCPVLSVICYLLSLSVV